MNAQSDQANISMDYEWLFYAATVLGITGVMRAFDGICAFGFDGETPSGLEGALLGTNMSTYGWVWIIVMFVVYGLAFGGRSRAGVGPDVVRACRLVPPVAGWWRPTPPAAMVPTRSRRVLARWGR